MVGQGDVHGRGVVRGLVLPVAVAVDGMDQAAALSAVLLRLVEGGEEQHEKGHVVVQGCPLEGAVGFSDGTAQAAVAALVPLQLRLRQGAAVCGHVSEHTCQLLSPETVPILP